MNTPAPIVAPQPRKPQRIHRLISYFERMRALRDVPPSRGLKAQRQRKAEARKRPPANTRSPKARKPKAAKRSNKH